MSEKYVAGGLASVFVVGATSSFAGNMLARKALESLRKPPPYRVQGELVSVIVPAWREENFLPNLLTSLQNQTYQPLETIIGFYQPSEQDYKIAEQFKAKYVIAEKRGIALARNLAAKRAEGNILFHTDCDCIFAHNTLELLVKDLENGADCSHGLNVLYDANPLEQTAWTLASFFKPYFWTSGRSICVKKEAFWSIRGFDETILVGEDKDLGIRLDLKGYKIDYDKKAIVATSARRIKKFGWRTKWIDSFQEYPAVRNGVFY